VTLEGLAHFAGEAAHRAVGIGYKAAQTNLKVGIGLGLGEAVGQGVSNVVGPQPGPIGALLEFNDKAFSNRPLSSNGAFMLVSAMMFPFGKIGSAASKSYKQWSYGKMGSVVPYRVAEKFAEKAGPGGKALKGDAAMKWTLEQFGGKEAFDGFMQQVHGNLVFKGIAPSLKESYSHFFSMDEAALKASGIKSLVEDGLRRGYEANSFGTYETIKTMEEWFAHRVSSGKTLNPVAFPWDGQKAIDVWKSYSAGVAPIGQVLTDRVVGLAGASDLPLPTLGHAGEITREELGNLKIRLEQAAVDGVVSNADVRAVLSDLPQLTARDKSGFWQAHLTDTRTAKLSDLKGRLTRMQKDAPTIREVTAPAARAEAEARKLSLDTPDVGPIHPNSQGEPPTATLSASAFRPSHFGVDGSVRDGIAARGSPAAAQVEHNIADAMRSAGFDVNRTNAVVGGKASAPHLELVLNTSGIEENRIAAAIYGRSIGADRVVLSTTGEALARSRMKPNGVEIVYQLPQADPAYLQVVSNVLARTFPDFTINTETGFVKVLVRSADSAELDTRLADVQAGFRSVYPSDAAGADGIVRSMNPAYFERIGRSRENDVTYQSLARGTKSDPRWNAEPAIKARVSYQRPAPDVAGGPATGPEPVVGGAPGGNGPVNAPGAAAPVEPGTARSYLDTLMGPDRPAYAQDFPYPEPGYVYHGTNRPLESIRRDGINVNSHWSSDQGGGTVLTTFGDTLVRMKPSSDIVWSGKLAGTVDRPVPPSALEYWGADGAWHPLAPAAPVGSPVESYGFGNFQSVQAEPGYIYHATNADNAQAIASEGMQTHLPNYGTDQVAWPDGATGKRAYFIGDPQAAAAFAPAEGQPVLLRALQDNVRNVKTEIGTGDLYTNRSVPAHNLEVLGGDGQWRPLDTYFQHPNGDVPPALAPAAEVAAPIWDQVPLASRPDNVTQAMRLEQDRLAAEKLGWSDPQAAMNEAIHQAVYDAQIAADIPQVKLHGPYANAPAEVRAELDAFNRRLRQELPGHEIKPSPNVAWMWQPDLGPVVGALRQREGLMKWLEVSGPFSRLSRMLEWATAPVEGGALTAASHDAIYAEFVQRGMTPDEVRKFIGGLRKIVDDSQVTEGGIKLYPQPTNLPAHMITGVAQTAFSAESLAKIGGAKNAYKLLDQASNRFIRSVHAKGPEAGRLSRALEGVYRFGQDTPGVSGLRYIKVFYHTFRFILDPRWHAMNATESDIIGGLSYGQVVRGHGRDLGDEALALAARGDMAGAELARRNAAAFLSHSGGSLERLNETTGWYFPRKLAGVIERSFGSTRKQVEQDILRSLSKEEWLNIRAAFPDARSVDDIVPQLEKMLYDYDTKGVKATLGDTITADQTILAGDLTREQFAPIVQRLYEVNDKTFREVVNVFEGNARRTNIERVLNSYWLYWPISYQLKAGRWMYDLLTKRIAGRETNALGAYTYSQLLDAHREGMTNDQGYATMFSENPTAWFFAQMMFPILPGDMGVSLSRPVRYGTSLLLSAAGAPLTPDKQQFDLGPLGYWGHYAKAKDPMTALFAVADLGPIYTWNQLQKVTGEMARSDKSKTTTTPYTPTNPSLLPPNFTGGSNYAAQ
jgi:hypothetical protein